MSWHTTYRPTFLLMVYLLTAEMYHAVAFAPTPPFSLTHRTLSTTRIMRSMLATRLYSEETSDNPSSEDDSDTETYDDEEDMTMSTPRHESNIQVRFEEADVS